jgi:hypothetical protein
VTGKFHRLPLGREADVDEFRIEILADHYGVSERHGLNKIGETIRYDDVDYEFVAVDTDSILLRRCIGGDLIRVYLSGIEPLDEISDAVTTAALP